MLETRIDSQDFLSQLNDELVTDYTADDDNITTIVTALLAFQVHGTPITVGTIQPTVSRSMYVEQDMLLPVLLRLRDTVGGYIEVDIDRQLNWWDDLGEDKGQQIRYRKNLKGITRSRDFFYFGNRLYCYGEGEGDARIKLSDADGQDEDYVEDGTSQAEHGICIRQLSDKSITHPDTLLAWAILKLAEMKDPYTSYSIDIANLEYQSGFSFETLQLGSIVTVIDEDLGIDISARVVKILRDLSNPINITVNIANKSKDIIDTLAGLYDNQQLESHIATKIGAGHVIVKGVFTVLDWVTGGTTTIDGSNITTGTLAADRIIAGTIESQTIIIKGVAGILKSDNYVAGTSGWQIKGDGNAEFNNVTIRGTVYATAGEFTGTLKVTNIEAGKTLTVNGAISAGGGDVIISSSGIIMKGQLLDLQDDNGVSRGVLFGSVAGYIALAAIDTLYLDAGVKISLNKLVLPVIDKTIDIGSLLFGLKGLFLSDGVGARLKIPVGTDLYD